MRRGTCAHSHPNPGGPGLCELHSPDGRNRLMGHVSGGWCFCITEREAGKIQGLTFGVSIGYHH